MPMSDVRPGRLQVLSDTECWDLLRTHTVGRIAWSGDEGGCVVPVNFAVDDGDVVLRTTPYSLMARDCVNREVGFEVDVLDQEAHLGWSVLVRGRCERQERPSDGPHPWVTGSRVLGLRITPRSVTGRRIVSSAGAGS